MKFCFDCGAFLEELGLVPGCSGRSLYGCPKCDALWEVHHCSVSGQVFGCQKTRQKYSSWRNWGK